MYIFNVNLIIISNKELFSPHFIHLLTGMQILFFSFPLPHSFIFTFFKISSFISSWRINSKDLLFFKKELQIRKATPLSFSFHFPKFRFLWHAHQFQCIIKSWVIPPTIEVASHSLYSEFILHSS